MDCRAYGYRMQVTRVPLPRTLGARPMPYGVTDTRRVQASDNKIFSCRYPPGFTFDIDQYHIKPRVLWTGVIYHHEVGCLEFVKEYHYRFNLTGSLLSRGSELILSLLESIIFINGRLRIKILVYQPVRFGRFIG
jgi:hypothetical protein